MESVSQRRRNGLLWAGFFFLILGILNFAILAFVSFPGQQFVPWLDLAFFAAAVILFIAGLRRSMTQPQVYRGKVAGWIFTVVAVLLLGFTSLSNYKMRELPASGSAPQVGQKVPEFSLADINGQTVSLAQLESAPGPAGARPKAVLLVFYRGYW
jgi:hypothetical protein